MVVLLVLLLCVYGIHCLRLLVLFTAAMPNLTEAYNRSSLFPTVRFYYTCFISYCRLRLSLCLCDVSQE